MTTVKRLVTTATTILLLLSIVRAQEQNAGIQSAITVTAAASTERVRFTAPSTVVQMRLEVYASNGEKLFDNEIRGGNVIDWHLLNGQAERLLDGTYLCVITSKNLSGRISQKLGRITIDNAAVSVHPVVTDQLTAQQSQVVGPVEENPSFTILKEGDTQTATVIAHNGIEGQLIRGQGALSFRLGDFFAGTDKEQMRLTAEGNLGIGTTEPRVKLDVAGMIAAREGVMFSDGSTLNVNKKGILKHTSPNGDVSAAAAGSGTQNRLAKWTDNAGTLGDSVITENASGFLGVGTASPASLLHLAGASGVNAITLNSPGTHKFRFQTVPGVPNWGALTLNANFNAGWVLDDTTTNGWFFKLDTRGGNAPGPNNGLWLFNIPAGTNPHTDESPAFGVSNGQAYFAGNVGIGTLSPLAPLDVVGDIKVSGNANIAGNIAAKYQDIAEWVPSRQPMAAGTVVVLDTLRANAVVPSTRSYSGHVAGVVSAQPGLILGEGGAGKVLVATTGRVKVKVDATRYPIKIGDFLVTSGETGVAMRSRPIRVGGILIHRPGTIIGKALEPLSKGRGEILVLLSLQ